MGHVHLNVNDVDAQRKFWVEQFEAAPLRKEGLQGVEIPGMLILFRKQAPTGSNEGTMMDHFGVKVPNTGAVVKRCRDAGYQIQREFKGSEGFPNAYIIGPDGVRVELQEDSTQTMPVMGYHLHFMNREGDQITLRDVVCEKFWGNGEEAWTARCCRHPRNGPHIRTLAQSARGRIQGPFRRPHWFRSEEFGSVLQKARGQWRETGLALQKNPGGRHCHCFPDGSVWHLRRADRGPRPVLKRALIG